MKLKSFTFQIALIVVINSFCYADEEYKSYKGYKGFKIFGQPEQLIELNKKLKVQGKGEILTEYVGDELHILVSPSYLLPFQNLTSDKNRTVIHEDYSEYINKLKTQSRKSSSFMFDEYHDIDDIYKYLKKTSDKRRGIYLIVGGDTSEKRQILGLRINGSSKEDSNKTKPSVIIEAGIHGREWVAPAAILFFIKTLIENKSSEIAALKNSFDWHIFPVVNPDGYHYSFTTDRMWRKSRSGNVEKKACLGVDLNRNWGYHWGEHDFSNDPCDYEMYAGKGPFSEIETLTLSNYISSVKNLKAYLSFHCDANCLLIPYAYSTRKIADYDNLLLIGKSAIEFGRKRSKLDTKGPGIPNDVMHLAASGCSMDWVYRQAGVPLTYTFELRGDMFGWPREKIPQQGEEVTQMILGLMSEAGNLGYFDFKIN